MDAWLALALQAGASGAASPDPRAVVAWALAALAVLAVGIRLWRAVRG